MPASNRTMNQPFFYKRFVSFSAEHEAFTKIPFRRRLVKKSLIASRKALNSLPCACCPKNFFINAVKTDLKNRCDMKIRRCIVETVFLRNGYVFIYMPLDHSTTFQNRMYNDLCIVCLCLSIDGGNYVLWKESTGVPVSSQSFQRDKLVRRFDSVFMASIPRAMDRGVHVDLRKSLLPRQRMKVLGEFL